MPQVHNTGLLGFLLTGNYFKVDSLVLKSLNLATSQISLTSHMNKIHDVIK